MQHQQQQSEQTALDYAQSAAARMTATGSAAAAMAAAKFKLLRSNTLAAAFGRPSELPDGGGEAPASASGQPAELMALRTKDERVVNQLSAGTNRQNRFDLS